MLKHTLLILSTSLLLTACGGSSSGSSSSSSTTTPSGSSTTFLNGIAISRTAENDSCERLDTGIDKNSNGVLDESEIQNSYNICATPTFKIENDVADSNCEYGATKLHIGLDKDVNGVLSDNEITQTHSFCQGPKEVVVETFSQSPMAKITGQIPTSGSSLIGALASKSIKSQTGELKLTPDALYLAIQANEKAVNNIAAEADISTPIIEPITIPVASDGSYEIDVPAGANYSLSYTDETTGVMLDDISVSAGTVIEKNIVQDEMKPLAKVELIIQDLDGNRIPEATIEILSGAGGTATADANGEIALENQPEGTHFVLVSAPGFVSQSKSILLNSGQNSPIIIEVNSLKGSASGQVQSSSLEDLSNIVVYAKDLNGTLYTSLTNSAGTFTFPSLPVGEGYSFIVVANDIDSAKIDNVTVTQAETVSIGAISLTPSKAQTGGVNGFALFEEKDGENNHAGIIVSVEGTDKEAITSRDGAFILNGLNPGDYTLNFTDSSHLPVTQEKVTVVAGSVHALDAVELKPVYGQIQGQLLDQNNLPIENARVTILSNGLTLYTDTDGRYSFVDVPIGSKQLEFVKDGYQSATQRVLVEANETSTVAVIRLAQYSFSFNVAISELEDLSGVQAIMSGEVTLASVSDETGHVAFHGVNPGNYQIALSRSGVETLYIPVVVPEDQPDYKLPYDIELKRQFGHISGNVTLLGASNHSGVKVTLAQTNYTTFTDSVGNWTIAAPIGNYQGVNYSKRLFAEQSNVHAITLTEFGVYSEEAAVLQQKYADAMVDLSAVGSCSQITVDVKGAGEDNSGFSTRYELSEGETALQLQGFALGQYRLTAACAQSGWETVSRDLSINMGQQSVELDDINLRQSYLTINDGASFTNSRTVDLLVGSTDAAYMQITDGEATTEWQAFSHQTAFELSASNGVKNIKVRLKDVNEAALADVTSSITLDTLLDVKSFSTTTKATKGDTLVLTLDLSGETKATVKATIPNLVSNLPLVDNGSNGDNIANDGIYSRTFVVTTANDFEVTPIASVVDQSGNSISFEAANSLILSTSPTIQNVDTSSNLATGKMTITFETDEVATSLIEYGISADSLENTLTMSPDLVNRHKVDLTGLEKNSTTFFKLTALDSAGNKTIYKGQSKLAPPPVDGLAAFPGNSEVGVVWARVNNSAGYQIFRSSDDGTTFELVSGDTLVSEGYFLDKLVINGQSYQYRVLAIDEDGNQSEQSAVVEATPSTELAGPTEIEGGILSTNTVWLASRSPYQITKKLKIPEGIELSLLPGTQVEFTVPNVEVVLDGQLYGYGEEENRIALEAQASNSPNITVNSTGNFFGYADIKDIGISGEQGIEADNVSISGESQVIMTFSNINQSTIFLKQGEITARTLKNSSIRYESGSLKVSSIYKSEIEKTNVDAKLIEVSNINNSNVVVKDIRGSNITLGVISYQKSIGSRFEKSSIQLISPNFSAFNYYDFDSSFSEYYFKFSGDYLYTEYGHEWSTSDLSYDLRFNYWEPNGSVVIGSNQYILDILAQTHADTRAASTLLYPLLTSTEMKSADWDQDTIPDYLDHDNDGDGYSDLQEYKESDFEFDVVFNPLGHSSHPESELDADMDGIADISDLDNDNDGITDADEEVLQTSPWLADSDLDGVDDALEVKYGYNPLDAENLPLSGTTDLSDVSRYKNSLGVISVIGDLNINNANITEGMEIKATDAFTISIESSQILAEKSYPFLIESKTSSIRLISSDVTGFVIKANEIYVDSNSEVSNSDIVTITAYNHGKVVSSFLSKPSSGWSSFYNYGVVESSYVSRQINSGSEGRIIRSYIPYGHYLTVFNVYESYVNFSLNGCYSGDANTIEIYKSILIGFRCVGTKVILKSSDIQLGIDPYSNAGSAYNNFFDQSFIQLPDGAAYTELGSPVDQNGDGEATTEIPYGDSTIKVDGINSPMSSPIYDAFDLQPYQTLDGIWDPTNVGVWWDMNNPNMVYDANPFQNTGTLKGKVLLPGATNHAGTTVSIHNTSYTTQTNSLGEWSFDLPARAYSNGIVIEREHMASITIDRTLTLEAGETTNLAEQTMTQLSAEVSGSLMVDNADSLSNAVITLTQGSTIIEPVLFPNGSFVFDSLDLGEYILEIEYPGGTWERFEKVISLSKGTIQLDVGVVHLRDAFVYINDEAEFTNTESVTLEIVNGSATQIQISITEDGESKKLSPEAYNYATSSQRSLTFTGGDGEKVVSVDFLDAQGNRLGQSSATITLDRLASINDVSINDVAQKGDSLVITVNTGEIDGTVSASVVGLFTNLTLNDDGIGADTLADDGIYSAQYLITTADEVSAPVIINFTDRAGNTDVKTTSEAIILATPPTISNVLTTSTSSGMTLTFNTNEPTSVTVSYGTDPLNLDQSVSQTEEASSFSFDVSGNGTIYYSIEVEDGSTATVTLDASATSNASALEVVKGLAGSEENGLIWHEDSRASQYRVYRSDDNVNFTQIAELPDSQHYYLDSGVSNGVLYHYRLTWLDAEGNESDQTASVSLTPLEKYLGPTEVNGAVMTVDTLWLASRSPYEITNNVLIKEGASLNLLPGTQVTFPAGDDKYILVKGELLGFGESEKMISITLDPTESGTNMYEEASKNLLVNTESGVFGKVWLDFLNLTGVSIGYNGGYNTSDIIIKNSTIILEGDNFTAKTIEDSDINIVNGSYVQSSYLKVTDLKSSNLKSESKMYMTATNIDDSIVENMSGSVSNIKSSTLINTSFESIRDISESHFSDSIVRSESSLVVSNSSFMRSTVYGSYSLNMHFSSFDKESSLSGFSSMDVSKNYWGSTNLAKIIEQTNYVADKAKMSHLYPIITSADIYHVDWDLDGIPDYRDYDNDNDGYSDLQEDWSSEPDFNLVYDPLDIDFHPDGELDADMDGIADAVDTDDDNDGLSDDKETELGTNPYVVDTDGDGASDSDEVNNKYDPLDSGTYPITGSLSHVELDSRYQNSDGNVILIGSNPIYFDDVSLSDSIKIYSNSTSLVLRNLKWSSGVTFDTRGTLSFESAKVSNCYLKSYQIYVYSGSILKNCDFYIDGGSFNYGYIYNSYLSYHIYNHGEISNSYFETTVSNYAIINDSKINSGYYAYHGSDASRMIIGWLCFDGGGVDISKISNSIINSIHMCNGAYSLISDSDVYLNSNSFNINAFFDGSYLATGFDITSTYYDGLGEPADTFGDRVVETSFTVGSNTYTVDGIVNPRSTRVFPNGEADLWNPEGVGYKWTPDATTTNY